MNTLQRFLMFILILVTVMGTAQAQEATETPEAIEDMIEVEAGVINFLFPADMATDVVVTEVEEVPMEAEMPYWAAMPAHTRVDFSEFGGQTDLIFPAYLLVIPTANLADYGGEDWFTMAGRTQALRTLLEERPDLESSEVTVALPEGGLPMVVVLNATQVFYTQPEYIDFEGGSGIRYLTYYSQAVDPITEGWVFYTFQGITDDGETVIAAVIPVDTGLLPEPAEMDYENFDYETFSANYTTYLQALVDALSTQPAEDFEPSLETLDTIVESIQVNAE